MRFDFLIIAGGKPPQSAFIKKLLKISKNVVTVDRGARVARRLGVRPYLHVGDGDSFSEKELKRLKARATIVLPSEKSVSDLEYAIDALPAPSWKVIIASHVDFEGRSDHSFVNLVLLSRLKNSVLADENGWIKALTPSLRFKVAKNTLFSVVPFRRGSRASVVGARYSLKNQVMKFASQGLSNVSLGRTISIKCNKALLFVNAPLTETEIDDSQLRR